MARKPESRLQKRIRSRLEATVGGFWRKVWGGPYQAVFLDLVGCVEGLYIELEVKIPKKWYNTSELQKLAIRKIKKAGGISGVVTSPDEAVELVQEALARAKRSGRLRASSGERRTVLPAKDRQDIREHGHSRKAAMAAARARRRAARLARSRLDTGT